MSRALKKGLHAIVASLKDDTVAMVLFSSRASSTAELSRQQYFTAPYPLRFFACADGAFLMCTLSPTEKEQLHMCSGKDYVHCWNNIFVVGLTGKIIAYPFCWPGSTHDAS